jgi:hypothetical protein
MNGEGPTNPAAVDSGTYATRQATYSSGVDRTYLVGATASAANVALSSTNGAHTHTVSGTTGSAGSTAGIAFDVNFVDVIIATRD